jgi:hypothetical protein
VNTDPVLASLSVLGVEDVGAARAVSLRRRCHVALALQATASESTHQPPGWRRWFAPAVATAWSAVYVVETIRRALALYRAN